jgi:hypothetical protein
MGFFVDLVAVNRVIFTSVGMGMISMYHSLGLYLIGITFIPITLSCFVWAE